MESELREWVRDTLRALASHSKDFGFYLKNSETLLEAGSKGVIFSKLWA